MVNEKPIQELADAEVKMIYEEKEFENENEVENKNENEEEINFDSALDDINIPANIIALGRLEYLLRLNCFEKGLFKEYYFELGNIFRDYFIDTFDAFYSFELDSNTDSLLSFVARTNIFGGDFNAEFRQFIEMKAKVNSGLEMPTLEQAKTSLKDIKSFVLYASKFGWYRPSSLKEISCGNHKRVESIILSSFKENEKSSLATIIKKDFSAEEHVEWVQLYDKSLLFNKQGKHEIAGLLNKKALELAEMDNISYRNTRNTRDGAL